MFTKDGLVHQ